jgi:hypothetical protein
MPFQPFAYDWDWDWDRPQGSGHEQWEWLAVEIAEIRRCAGVGDQAHNRLALLLTDHLVEVIVGREVNARLAWQPADSVIEEMREIRDRLSAEPPAILTKAIDEHVGPKQRRQIDDHLDEKTKYLVKQGVLTSEERDVLSRMHVYRNAAYHRDTLDGDLISDLVLAYMMLASQLLARCCRTMVVPLSARVDKLPGLLTDGLEIDLKEMAGRFSDHAAKRVDDIGRAVGTARVLLLVATDGDLHEDVVRLLTTVNGVAPAQLRSWVKRASDLKTVNIKSLVNLMKRYIGLDQKLCEIEQLTRRLQTLLDRWEQDYLDEIKGK